ncbi:MULTISPECIES: helix-turn-helix domain-containing protein [Leuconostoc]|uniref:helix-turn-helix domain-containing protein n=1 Tax=Leuconostoc TaxID=1243 RepID=UPI00166B775B|nr:MULTISPECIES: helix-turn-helix transcriptional regulator [Leuconostoc]MBK0040809.1 helix-turn-helix domain-containing protein [Leuconostoc sp. S51]MBK0051769.1 helix-turn-helix domain-containing protein [Leuconostoc sp. S50]
MSSVIGKYLRELRYRHGWTQADLERMTNVKYQRWSSIETGIRPRLSENDIVAIYKLYGIDYSTLIKEAAEFDMKQSSNN